ncbi:hypothetical protein JSR02_00105 [Candidatus Vidania fulgoroideae]|uniref:Uncharacterized protein n=1 Tax=Candidatus Vidania fulgoroideorum TaxID=881286 RepID=A0A974X908_9PROT|nr:hypothetical protein JSR02_00105 [Candidatus Vidania fulgoroideae]
MIKFVLYKVIVDYINSIGLGKCLFLDSCVARRVARSLSNVTVFTSTFISNLSSYDFLLVYSKNICFDFFVRRLAFLTVYEKLLLSYFDSVIVFYNGFVSSGFIDIPIKLVSKFLLSHFLQQRFVDGVRVFRDFNGNLFMRLPVSNYCILNSIFADFFNVSCNGLFYLRPTVKRLLVNSAGIFD